MFIATLAFNLWHVNRLFGLISITEDPSEVRSRKFAGLGIEPATSQTVIASADGLAGAHPLSESVWAENTATIRACLQGQVANVIDSFQWSLMINGTRIRWKFRRELKPCMYAFSSHPPRQSSWYLGVGILCCQQVLRDCLELWDSCTWQMQSASG